jgi:hypothetical protein
MKSFRWVARDGLELAQLSENKGIIDTTCGLKSQQPAKARLTLHIVPRYAERYQQDLADHHCKCEREKALAYFFAALPTMWA